MAGRAFVLLPLAQVAPYWRHPATGHTAEEMARALPAEETEGLLQISPL
jgi:2-amino-4-hydroxy-6-hydroxymethyldihydropteridine diphosphokinase